MLSEQIAASRSFHVTASSHLDSSLDQKKALVRESAYVNICRICHGGESKEELVKPCECKGSLALVHHSCLERWLRESLRTDCEVCRHKYEIIRQSRHTLTESIYLWVKEGARPSDIERMKQDSVTFCVYTPTTIGCVYALVNVTQSAIVVCQQNEKGLNAHSAALIGMLGIAFVNLTYLNWLFSRCFVHFNSWKQWWLSTCEFKLILPPEEVVHYGKGVTQTMATLDDHSKNPNTSTNKGPHGRQRSTAFLSDPNNLSFVHTDEMSLLFPVQ